MKEDHAKKGLQATVLSDTAAAGLAGCAVSLNNISNSVVTINQLGGQAAQTINNFGPPQRQIPPHLEQKALSILREAPASVGIASTQGDAEAHKYKLQLIRLFSAAGWQVQDMQTFMFFGSRDGLVVTIPFGVPENGAPQTVASALAALGNPVSGNRGDMANECGIYIQVWHAPQS